MSNSNVDMSSSSKKCEPPGTTLEQLEIKEEDELDANRDQREVAMRLSHYVHSLLYIINHQMTTIESLQAQLGTLRVFQVTVVFI